MATIKGLGRVKAVTICAALELGRRRRESEAILEKIANSRDAAAIMQPHLADLSHEEFWVILLNRANKVITRKNISVGGTSGTVVDAKIIFKEAIQARCSGIILCHNHPSGNNKPSEADIQLTRKLKEGALQLDLAILDHIIIAGSSFFSFADEGLL
jgi:DNA repair protein RadC